jgi:thiol:disulfide interchange protein
MGIANADSIQWETNLDTAIAKAKVEKKNIMIMIESDYCRWCHKMHDTTLSDQKVKKALSGYVALKIDRSNPQLLKSFPAVAGVPTILFITPNKKILATALGYVETYDFMSYLRDAANANKK